MRKPTAGVFISMGFFCLCLMQTVKSDNTALSQSKTMFFCGATRAFKNDLIFGNVAAPHSANFIPEEPSFHLAEFRNQRHTTPGKTIISLHNEVFMMRFQGIWWRTQHKGRCIIVTWWRSVVIWQKAENEKHFKPSFHDLLIIEY